MPVSIRTQYAPEVLDLTQVALRRYYVHRRTACPRSVERRLGRPGERAPWRRVLGSEGPSSPPRVAGKPVRPASRRLARVAQEPAREAEEGPPPASGGRTSVAPRWPRARRRPPGPSASADRAGAPSRPPPSPPCRPRN